MRKRHHHHRADTTFIEVIAGLTGGSVLIIVSAFVIVKAFVLAMRWAV